MINLIYRLVSPRQFEVTYKDRSLYGNHVVVRPTHLSICAADQRYYTGKRNQEILDKKLPMALIHEAAGEVVYDPKGEYKSGTKVVMIPTTPEEVHPYIAENYLRSSKFRSSGYDGFMQDYVFMKRDRLVELPEYFDMEIAAFTELVTIATHCLSRFKEKSHPGKDTIGVWGDGNLGFITSLLLKHIYPESKIFVFGKTDYKLEHFSFVDEVFKINEIPSSLEIDHAIECVGGQGSKHAVEQMIDLIKPEGTIALLGVSEFSIETNTRMILEKGLTVFGSSRSTAVDFQNTIELYKKYPIIPEYLNAIVGKIIEVNDINDVVTAFETSLSNSWGKTIMRWRI